MKTKGMAHQIHALQCMNGRDYYALFMEQGTGKTWTILADAERLYAAGKIEAMLVICPNGLQQNWVRREIPQHMEVPVLARIWRSGAGKKEQAKLAEILKVREEGESSPLRVLAMNIDAINTAEGFEFAKKFVRLFKCLVAVDESSRIKNPGARRTKRVLQLSPLSAVRRIATGTPVTKAPVDLFTQMEFLEEGLLGTTSYRAFVAEYADLMDQSNPMYRKMVERNPKIAMAQIVNRDADGSPIWRNLDKLNRLLQPHSFRILKSECLDLPAKIYKQRYFELTPAQRKAYSTMEDELRIELLEGDIIPISAIASLGKLQQITSGFLMVPGQDDPVYIEDGNPRLKAMMDILEDLEGIKIIIWARFLEEIKALSRELTKAGRRVVEYHGRVSKDDRELALQKFQYSNRADVFLGQPQTGGIGLTLTQAQWVIYYSQDYNLETRLQSEDRAHRIGTKTNIIYMDLIATDTIDEPISRSLQNKSNMARTILDERRLPISEKILGSTTMPKDSVVI